MTAEVTEVLNHQQVCDRIKRIAWQIYETHQGEKELVLAGIVNSGYIIAELLAKELEEIFPIRVNLVRLKLNKKDPLTSAPLIEPEPGELRNASVVIVDDVLNTGSTLIYGVKHFLDYPVKQIKTVVLVDRNHKSFPVKADFKGLSLSTNMMEHVAVNIEKPPFSVTVS